MRFVDPHTVCTLVTACGLRLCAHYAMKGALQNDVKTTHHLKYTYITFKIGFDRGILQSPPLIYALSSVRHIPIYNKIFKITQKDVSILSALHPHAPK